MSASRSMQLVLSSSTSLQFFCVHAMGEARTNRERVEETMIASEASPAPSLFCWWSIIDLSSLWDLYSVNIAFYNDEPIDIQSAKTTSAHHELHRSERLPEEKNHWLELISPFLTSIALLKSGAQQPGRVCDQTQRIMQCTAFTVIISNHGLMPLLRHGPREHSALRSPPSNRYSTPTEEQQYPSASPEEAEEGSWHSLRPLQ